MKLTSPVACHPSPAFAIPPFLTPRVQMERNVSFGVCMLTSIPSNIGFINNTGHLQLQEPFETARQTALVNGTFIGESPSFLGLTLSAVTDFLISSLVGEQPKSKPSDPVPSALTVAEVIAQYVKQGDIQQGLSDTHSATDLANLPATTHKDSPLFYATASNADDAFGDTEMLVYWNTSAKDYFVIQFDVSMTLQTGQSLSNWAKENGDANTMVSLTALIPTHRVKNIHPNAPIYQQLNRATTQAKTELKVYLGSLE